MIFKCPPLLFLLYSCIPFSSAQRGNEIPSKPEENLTWCAIRNEEMRKCESFAKAVERDKGSFGDYYYKLRCIQVYLRHRNGEMPLPEGWDFTYDYDGKMYFIDHLNKETTWIDPRDSFTKPLTFADCIGEELPFGWEEGYDPRVGTYYIDHLNKRNQLEDPRLEWRAVQEAMVMDYLQTGQKALNSLSGTERQRSDSVLNQCAGINVIPSTSKTSLCSSGSSAYTKYDPESLKSDVALLRTRVSKLKIELDHLKNAGPSKETVTEKNTSPVELPPHEKEPAISNPVEKRQPSDDLTQPVPSQKVAASRSSLKESSGNVTELDPETESTSSKLEDVTRLRLEYDEVRKEIQIIWQKLSDAEVKLDSEGNHSKHGSVEEKTEMANGLSIANSSHEASTLKERVDASEEGLNKNADGSSDIISDRLSLRKGKQILLSQLREALSIMTSLESQLRNLVLPTFSGDSSVESLSSVGKGLQMSAASLTEKFVGGLETANEYPLDMTILNKRLEKLLSAGNPFTSLPHENTSNSDKTCHCHVGSVSNAISKESVVADSGVFDAFQPSLLNGAVATAQVQVMLRYSRKKSILQIGIERARNLSALCGHSSENELCMEVLLLPYSGYSAFSYFTNVISGVCGETINEEFSAGVPFHKLYSKTLQINVLSCERGKQMECLGFVRISLADFDTQSTSLKWYNILSFEFIEWDPSISTNVKSLTNRNTREGCSIEAPSESPKLTKKQSNFKLGTNISLSLENLKCISKEVKVGRGSKMNYEKGDEVQKSEQTDPLKKHSSVLGRAQNYYTI